MRFRRERARTNGQTARADELQVSQADTFGIVAAA